MKVSLFLSKLEILLKDKDIENGEIVWLEDLEKGFESIGDIVSVSRKDGAKPTKSLCIVSQAAIKNIKNPKNQF